MISSRSVLNLLRPYGATRLLHCSAARQGSDGPLPHSKHFPAVKTPMLPPDTFKGKTALVTGGGTGLGRGMAAMLSGLGADVAIASRRLPVLQSAAAAITAGSGREVLPLQCDIRDPAAVEAALQGLEERFGLPDIIINNAAGNFVSPSERLSPNAWRTVVDIVLNGTANVTLAAGRRLIAAGKGAAFLSITTHYTRQGSGFVSPSASAKAGVEAMSKSLSSEWGRYGMRFNCLAPGPVETEGAFSRLDPSGQFTSMAFKRIPAGRFGEVEEIANLACFLVSDYASWISGESIVIDGGEFPYCAGEFNMLDRVPKEQWDLLEQMIRQNNKEQKGKNE